MKQIGLFFSSFFLIVFLVNKTSFAQNEVSATCAEVSTLFPDYLDFPISSGSFTDLAIDVNGNVFFTDRTNKLIRKINPQGIFSTIAGTGTAGFVNGVGPSARFRNLQGIAVDANGNIFVADQGNHSIRKIDPQGVVSTFAGSSSIGFIDGQGSAARFRSPRKIAIDANNNIFVADQGNHSIRKIDPQGVVSTIAGTGTAGFVDGPGISAQFNYPTEIAVDATGNIFVTDNGHYIRKIDSQGIVSTIAGTGTAGFTNGPGISAQFNSPTGIAVDANNNLFVADRGNHSIRKIDPQGIVSTLAGTGVFGFADGPGISAQFRSPEELTIDGSGNIFVLDEGNNRIRKINQSAIVSTFKQPSFHIPARVTSDANGNIFVTDKFNNRIRKIDPQGIVSTLAGKGVFGFADGPGVSAQFRRPEGIVVDATGNIFVADLGNARIRKIDPQGVVSTFAGTGVFGFADGPGTVARFKSPSGMAIDATGNIFVADRANHRIRKIDSQGVVSTIAGDGTAGFADGPGMSAQFRFPNGIALDANGNIFITDKGNHRIRKIDSQGVVSTIAGDGTASFANGQGLAARFNSPEGIVIDAYENIFITDLSNTIRKIDTQGEVSSITRIASSGFMDGASSSAQFRRPIGLSIDATGSILVADSGNNIIRKINCIDSDHDNISDNTDNCPQVANQNQEDFDEDNLGDACDEDDDNDNVNDIDDAFPFDPAEDTDTDGDGIGNNADTDDDGDMQSDVDEIACGSDPLNSLDLSPDNDNDHSPDCIDLDDDNDGEEDTTDCDPFDAIVNYSPGDGCDDDNLLTISDAYDHNCICIGINPLDIDNDGVNNDVDCGPSDPTIDYAPGYDCDDLDIVTINDIINSTCNCEGDNDDDGIANSEDPDDDNDTTLDGDDAFPFDPTEDTDTDGDDIGNNADMDDDGDMVMDTDDAFPLDPTESADTDGDGIGDNADCATCAAQTITLNNGVLEVFPSSLDNSTGIDCGLKDYFFQTITGDLVPSIVFTCADIGSNAIKIVVIDAMGHQQSCKTTLIIEELTMSCFQLNFEFALQGVSPIGTNPALYSCQEQCLTAILLDENDAPQNGFQLELIIERNGNVIKTELFSTPTNQDGQAQICFNNEDNTLGEIEVSVRIKP